MEESLRKKVIVYTHSERFVKYKYKWIENCHHFFEDGYLFLINEEWIDARLNECDYVSLYQYIIRRLERELRDNKNLTDEDRKYLTDRLKDNRQMFFRELLCMIQDYCIG